MRAPTEMEKTRWLVIADKCKEIGMHDTAEVLTVYGNVSRGYRINNALYDDLKDIQSKLEKAFKLED